MSRSSEAFIGQENHDWIERMNDQEYEYYCLQKDRENRIATHEIMNQLDRGVKPEQLNYLF